MIKKQMYKYKAITLILLLLISNIYLFAQAEETTLPITRYGLFIGANNGGANRVQLQWAQADARRMSDVMTEVGGIAPQNAYLLLDSSVEQLEEGFANINREIQRAKTNSRRVELFVYYSGHSDETGLMIGEEILSYRIFREFIDNSNADLRVAILDSCASGAFTRIKGGVRIQPFLVDDSSQMSGHAFITSSSADEAAQESDQIRASFFTYFLISGLRGAADHSGDGRISLNEAYEYAFAETLGKTQETFAGPQHPSYDINLNGSGDLILSDIQTTDSSILIPENIIGRILVQDSEGNIIAEINKLDERPMILALAVGRYIIFWEEGSLLARTEVNLNWGENESVSTSDFNIVDREFARSRGNSEPQVEVQTPETLAELVNDSQKKQVEGTADNSEKDSDKVQGEPLVTVDVDIHLSNLPDVEVDVNVDIDADLKPEVTQIPPPVEGTLVPFHLSFVPGLEIGAGSPIDTSVSIGFLSFVNQLNGFQYGMIINSAYNANGAQLSGIGNQTLAGFNGAQIAGIYNINGARGIGSQLSGIFNLNGADVLGAQISGIFNITEGQVFGGQVGGIFNKTEGKVYGGQVGGIFSMANEGLIGGQVSGIFNMTEGDVIGAQLAGIFNIAIEDVYGLQVAGVFNGADQVYGGQIGVVNVANEVYGVQIGVVNIADDLYGIPIGIFSWIKNGIHEVEYQFGSYNTHEFALVNGSNNFYTRLSMGVTTSDLHNDITMFPDLTFGIDFGFRALLNPLFINFDIGVKRGSIGDNSSERFASIVSETNYNWYPNARLVLGFELGDWSLGGFLGVNLSGYYRGGSATRQSYHPEDSSTMLFLGQGNNGLEIHPSLVFGVKI
jgi:hypothetical protein